MKQWDAVPLEAGAGAPSLDVELLKRGLLSPLEVSAKGLVSEAFV